MPDVPTPERCRAKPRSRSACCRRCPTVRRYYERERPIELRPVEFGRYLGKKIEDGRFNVWIRTTGRLPDDPAIHHCVLAYASDMMLLDTALIPHGRSVFDRDIMAASLDHALWFHRPFRADDWLLYAQDSPNLRGARGFSRGLIFTARRHAGGLGGPGGPAAPAAGPVAYLPDLVENGRLFTLIYRQRRSSLNLPSCSDLQVNRLLAASARTMSLRCLWSARVGSTCIAGPGGDKGVEPPYEARHRHHQAVQARRRPRCAHRRSASRA